MGKTLRDAGTVSAALDVLGEYSRRREVYDSRARKEERRFATIGNLRLAVAVGAAVVAWATFGAGVLSPAWLALPAALFVALVIWHERVMQRQKAAERAVRLYQRGLDRLADRWAGQGEGGERFRDPQHLYADDLDLFGGGSLFQLLNGARTPVGEETLAEWLKRPADVDVVRGRQQAVEELRGRLDLREDLALLGEEVRSRLDARALLAWARGTPVAFAPRVRWVAPVLATLFWGVVAACFVLRLPLSFALPVLLAMVGFGITLRPKVLQVIGAVDEPGRDLRLLAEVLERLERESFTSPRLVALRGKLALGGLPPSRQIGQLSRLIDLLDSRRNPAFAPLAATLLWGTQFAVAIERWRQRHGAAVPQWLAAVGEVEALLSLAAYAYEHPADPFPELAREGPCYDGEALGHPLLPDEVCVRNSVRLDRHWQLLIVSGSNMSGKSTLLRAVGVNAVLAFAGAPVRARSLLVAPLVLGASMRVQDSLQAGASRFYAEISRLRDVVALAGGAVPLLFLLDELLSGTNSHDRRIGAEAVVKGLVERGAVGLVTTHDLALAQIAEELPGRAANVHFEDRMEGGGLVFDYTMRPGVVRRSNALELMRAVGLEVR